MEIDEKHASIILRRLVESQDPTEQIALVSSRDKQRTLIHRVILNVAAKGFGGWFDPNFREGKPEEFVLEDSDGQTIRTVVNFCYSGKIDLTEDNVEKCLAIATSAEIDLLEDKCHQFLSTKLCVTNSVKILTIADKYRLADLRRQAFNLICDKLETVPASTSQKLSHQILNELLECKKIQRYGDLFINHLLEWFHYDECKRSVHMMELIKSIHLNLLTPEFLCNKLDAVFKKLKCSHLMNDEYKRRVAPRLRSVFCVFVFGRCHIPENYTMNENSDTVIDIYKYNNTFTKFLEVCELETSRTRFGVVLQGEKIFIVGGRSTYNMILNTMSSYTLNTGEEEVLPRMKFPRENSSAILVGKYIYVFGGSSDSYANRFKNLLISCERFDTENNTWETISSMKRGRELASTTLWNEYICIAGGVTKNSNAPVDLYDPKLNEWTQMPPIDMPGTTLAITECNGSLYALGGQSRERILKKFDSLDNIWTMFVIAYGQRMSSLINIDGELFATEKNGDFGRVELDQSGICTFRLLCESKHKCHLPCCHFWFHV